MRYITLGINCIHPPLKFVMVTGVEQTTPACAVQEAWHFIGIGGIGMSALAYLLVKQGAQVSGSDLQENAQTRRLKKLGVTIHFGHCAENIQPFPNGVQRVVYSTAIDPKNPEVIIAQAHGLPLLHRAQVLALLAEGHKTLGVSGTHGKTTTSGMLACLLTEQEFDPLVMVGGDIPVLGGNARYGRGEYLVAEVDESDGSLIRFYPHIAIVTNIEADHLDHYQDLNEIVQAFQQYIRQSEQAVLCLDDEQILEHLTNQDIPWLGYSLKQHPQAHYTVDNITYQWDSTTADVYEHGQQLGTLYLQVPAAHNLSNALAVLAVGRQLGMSFGQIQESLGRFTGVKRRFQKRGEVNDILYIEDYAHHPTEIRATLQSACLSGRRVVAIFQPHRYSRTHGLFAEFVTCFAQADCVVLTDIYAASEENVQGISGQDLAQAVAAQHPSVHYCVDLAAVRAFLPQILRPGDLALFLGAGNINAVITQLLPD